MPRICVPFGSFFLDDLKKSVTNCKGHLQEMKVLQIKNQTKQELDTQVLETISSSLPLCHEPI